MTRGLERQLPRELAQRGILAANAEGHLTINVDGGDEFGDSGLLTFYA